MISFLDRLTENQRDIVVSLPYRVGLWVSQSDSGGGAAADDREHAALAAILHAFAEDMFGSETMQHIISGTLTARDKWPQWAGQVSTVPQDCQFALDLLRDYTDAKDVNVFRNHLMEIGEAVALAFREDQGASFFVLLRRYLAYVLKPGKMGPGQQRRNFSEYLRISDGERKALAGLARALGTTY